MKKDYTVLLIQPDGNLVSDVSTRCSGRPHCKHTKRVLHESALTKFAFFPAYFAFPITHFAYSFTHFALQNSFFFCIL